MKRPFQIGERVKFYGGYFSEDGVKGYTSDGFKGTIFWTVSTNASIGVRVSPEFEVVVHSIQCRRLKPKPSAKRAYLVVPDYATRTVDAYYDRKNAEIRSSRSPGAEVQEFVRVIKKGESK